MPLEQALELYWEIVDAYHEDGTGEIVRKFRHELGMYGLSDSEQAQVMLLVSRMFMMGPELWNARQGLVVPHVIMIDPN